VNRPERKKTNYYTDYDIQLHPTHDSYRWLTYANFYVKEDFFTSAEVDRLEEILSDLDKHQGPGSVIGYNSDQSKDAGIRDSSIVFLHEYTKTAVPAFEHYDQEVYRRVFEINKNIFNLDLTCSMDPQYTSYGIGQYFEWHPDGPFGVMDGRGFNSIPSDLLWRKLSVSIALNDETEYEGGDFQIMNASGNPECTAINTVRLNKGSAIIFPAFASHRVTPVKKGRRKSLIYWFCGPRWR
jgi:PKHD-type hydroxylase